MIRRRLTLKRVDPWSVLKFGFVVNIALMLVAMLGFWILWIVIQRLGLVDQFCDSVGTVVLDLQECSLNGGNIFRTLLFLGLLGVVVQTGIMVFGAFLYNLISDLTGGLGFSFLDETSETGRDTRAVADTASSVGTPGRDQPGARTGAAAGAAASASSTPSPSSSSSSSSVGAPPRSASPPGGPPDQSSTPREPTPDGPPPVPGRQSGPPASPGSGGQGGQDGSGGPSPDRTGSSGSSLWSDPTQSNDRT